MNYIIAYNEMITAGTYMEMQSVSAVTNTEIRTIASSADTPVAINYNVHVSMAA
jgi:hypothetical protein